MKKNFFIIISLIFGLTQNCYAYSSDPQQFINEIVIEAKKFLLQQIPKSSKKKNWRKSLRKLLILEE